MSEAKSAAVQEHELMNAWRLDLWNALPDVCFIAGCDNDDIDQRGPVMLRDGSMHKACAEHWVAIFRILGEQVAWERDAMWGG